MFKNKLRKVFKIIKHPSRILGVIIDKFGRNLSFFLHNKSFFLQGQMDISPLSVWHKAEFINSTGGFLPKNSHGDREICELEPWDNTRRDMIALLLRTIIERDIEGDFAELGVYKGYTAKLIHKYAPEKKLYLFDTFSGFNKRGTDIENQKTNDAIDHNQFSDTSLELVKKYIDPNENIRFFEGYFPDNLPEGFENMKFALVHLDADLYDPTMSGLQTFYSKINQGGIIIIHDYNAWIGARTAVDEFFSDKIEKPIPMPDKSGSAIIIKQ